jgi:hypothetical protein
MASGPFGSSFVFDESNEHPDRLGDFAKRQTGERVTAVEGG